MKLKILLPTKIFADKTEVISIIAESHSGCFGILPHRLDCVASLVPSILTYTTKTEGEVYVAVDEGVLVKDGEEVLVSVRRAIGGVALDKLRALVKSEFLSLDAQESELHRVLGRLETEFLKQLSNIDRD